jgi:FkbM family methyltransferase
VYGQPPDSCSGKNTIVLFLNNDKQHLAVPHGRSFKVNFRQKLRRLLRCSGYDIRRYHPAFHPLARRESLLRAYNIDVVIDVGANTGQYAAQLRNELGFQGRIVSCEPTKAVYAKLEQHAAPDPNWKTLNCAVGNEMGQMEINVSGNTLSSSLLPMHDTHRQLAPESEYVRRELVEVRTLDDMIDEITEDNDNIYLKIDTQGFEGQVLRGAEKALARIDTVQLEMPLTPLYEGEMEFQELYALMLSKGYCMVSVDPDFSDAESGRMLQVDGTFHRFDT